MFKRNTMLLLTGLSASLAACGPANRSIESVNQPVVQRTDYVFDAATDGSALSPGEMQRVAGWLGSLRLAYGDRVYVDDPSNGTARRQVAAEAGRYGILLSDPAPVTAGAIQPGMVRVIVSRMKASVPGCPNYSRMGGTEFEASTSSNFGCASNSNLAAMVARPEDLVRGQPGAETVDPQTNYKAIDALRKAPASGAGGLKEAKTGGGGN
ncbi:CpaD family pilus assembly protein [Sphingomonas sp. MG17]|uniref:CpaD family pilus assembly protein n=1 Tax=Sphingomonas tagetis TaxID=2949092 RepID=A0A9X2HLW8_9SPHN|nr:CpaD family pilus assembly lipoprotein [Sphingomonas tagetis]MCP3730144.1 CpaD family pilus assembly protein [Sphingomonas tagetis]